MRFKQQMLVIVSLLIIIGFAITATVSFVISRQAALDVMVQHELPLTSDNIYAEVQRDLILPRTVSSFMGNDTFLQDWILEGEEDLAAVTRYLNGIKHKYGAFTAFMVSEKTRNYYHAGGLLKQVSKTDPRDEWYFRVRVMEEESELNIDPDMANQDALTIFINYKIHGPDGDFIGATGLGLNLENIKKILNAYRERYSNNVYFVTRLGNVLLHDEQHQLSKNLSQEPGMKDIVQSILSDPHGSYTYMRNGKTFLLNTRHIDELGLILCVEAEEEKVFDALRPSLFVTAIVCILVTLIVLVLLLRVIKHYQAELELIAWRDPLTGLLNRRAFVERYEAIRNQHERSGLPLSLLLVDIDHFKEINDQHGHTLGDQVLQLISDRLTDTLRPSDLVSRWGGDEFLLLLSETDLDNAKEIAERIRNSLKQDQAISSMQEQVFTVSIGIAEQQNQFDLDKHIQEADAGLYQAKQAGRDCIRAV